MSDATEPACWSWLVTQDDLAAARQCPENFGHVLLWNWQQARCAVCGVDVATTGRLRRDHDHSTGLTRGLLCTRCNAMEGLAAWIGVPGNTYADPHDNTKRRDFRRWRSRNAKLILRMAGYRAVNPASRLGLVVRHRRTLAPSGVILPRQYDGPLPILHIDGPDWRKFYATTGGGGDVDRRLTIIRQVFAWYDGETGADLPVPVDTATQ